MTAELLRSEPYILCKPSDMRSVPESHIKVGGESNYTMSSNDPQLGALVWKCTHTHTPPSSSE